MISLQNALKDVWKGDFRSWRRLPLFIFLFIFSLPYGAAVIFRNFLYDSGLIRSKRLPCPVISVGNITVGGTGKTPTVMMLAGMLKERGRKPAVLSRGYRRKRGPAVLIASDGLKVLAEHGETGDEPFMVAARLPGIPVLVASSRYAAGKTAIEKFGVDVLILDDGFQHRRLQRDVEILLMDVAAPFGNGFLLPCGSLREPVKALKRADAVLLTGGGRDGKSGAKLPPEPALPDFPVLYYGCHRPSAVIGGGRGELPLGRLEGKRVYAFAGIGNPLSFRRTVESLGAVLAGFASFSDHHAYTGEDIALLRAERHRLKAEMILTTEKDGVRLRNFPDFLREICLLRIEMAVTGEGEDLLGLIEQKLTDLEKGKNRSVTGKDGHV